MSKKQNSTTAKNLVQILICDHEANQNGIEKLPRQFLENWCEDFLTEVRNHALTEKVLRNTAPEVPGDKPPAEKEYPSRTELKPTPEPVPSPDKTETAKPTKISIPNQPDEVKRFGVALGVLARKASDLWAIVADENQSEKNDARRYTFDALDEVKSSIYDL
jgi:hypothetical protein